MPAAASLGSETYGWEHAPNGGRGEVRQSHDSTSMLPKHSSSPNSEPNGRLRNGAGPGEKSETGKHAGSSGEQSRLLRDILCRAGPRNGCSQSHWTCKAGRNHQAVRGPLSAPKSSAANGSFSSESAV